MAERSNANIIIALTIALVVGVVMSWAGSDGGARVGALPVFALCGALAFAINWLVFVPSALVQTEHYYDLTGGITYITVTAVAVYFSDAPDLRAMLVAAMVIFWAFRLSTFLFLRISKSGKDGRFDDIKNRPLRFLLADKIDLTRKNMALGTGSQDGYTTVKLQDPNKPGDGSMTLRLRNRPPTLTEWAVTDASGSRTRVILETLEYDRSLSPQLFNIELAARRWN